MTGRGTGRAWVGAKDAVLAEASLLLAAFFAGTDVVSVKYALEGFPPLVFMPMRYVVAGFLLLASLRFLGRKDRVGIGSRGLLVLSGLGLVGVALNHVGHTVGLSLTSGSNASLVFATAPVWGLLLGVVLGLERGSWRGALGLGLAIAGVALVVGGGPGSPEASVGGDLLVCPSAFSWGAYTVLSLPVLRRHDPLVVAGWTMLLGGAWALPLAFTGFPGLSEPLSSVRWGSVSAASWAAVAYSTVLCSSFAIAPRGRSTCIDWGPTGSSSTVPGDARRAHGQRRAARGGPGGEQDRGCGRHPAGRLPGSPRLELRESTVRVPPSSSVRPCAPDTEARFRRPRKTYRHARAPVARLPE